MKQKDLIKTFMMISIRKSLRSLGLDKNISALSRVKKIESFSAIFMRMCDLSSEMELVEAIMRHYKNYMTPTGPTTLL